MDPLSPNQSVGNKPSTLAAYQVSLLQMARDFLEIATRETPGTFTVSVETTDGRFRFAMFMSPETPKTAPMQVQIPEGAPAKQQEPRVVIGAIHDAILQVATVEMQTAKQLAKKAGRTNNYHFQKALRELVTLNTQTPGCGLVKVPNGYQLPQHAG